jgi:hypothetical protein
MEVVMDNDGRMALDYIKIEQTLARYARSIDRMDRDLILSVYWEDAHDSHGVFEGGPVEFADWVGAYLGRFKAFSHFLGQSSIDLQGDHADCETYFTTYKHDAQDSGDVMSLVGGGIMTGLSAGTASGGSAEESFCWTGPMTCRSKMRFCSSRCSDRRKASAAAAGRIDLTTACGRARWRVDLDVASSAFPVRARERRHAGC